jgi:glycosyltransferase involved in cell wall biosynthesis
VIDDGSSDRTLELLEAIQDERLKVYSYSNKGVSIARNRGISLATGDYLSFIDADDLWTKDKLEKQLAALQQNPQAGVAYSWIVSMTETPDSNDKRTFFPGKKVLFQGNIYPQLLLENFIGNGSNILFRREAISSVGNLNPKLTSCADWDYYLRLAAKWSFVLVPEHQIIYRKPIGIETMTSKTNVMEREGLFVIKKAFEAAPSELQYLKNKSLSKFYRYCSELYFNYTSDMINIKKARQRLWRSIRLNQSILLEEDTQILIIRVLFKQLIPNNIKNYLFSLFVLSLTVKDPRNS